MLTETEKLDRQQRNSYIDLNPYKGCENVTDGSRRLNVAVATEPFNFILMLRGGLIGTMATTINLLIDKLVKKAKERGMVDMSDRLVFEKFMQECEIDLPNIDDFQKGYDNGYTAGYAHATAGKPAAKLILDEVVPEVKLPTKRKKKNETSNNI